MGMDPIPEEYERGQRDSAADIAAGSPKLYWQTRGSWGELLSRLMADRFGVAVKHTSDMTTHREVSYHEGYNHRTQLHIDEVFGACAFQSVIDEVQQYRLQQYDWYLENKRVEGQAD